MAERNIISILPTAGPHLIPVRRDIHASGTTQQTKFLEKNFGPHRKAMHDIALWHLRRVESTVPRNDRHHDLMLQWISAFA